MKIIFCEGPLSPKQVDSMYLAEADVVRELGIDYGLINFEALVSGSMGEAVRGIAKSEISIDAIYHGWMLKPIQYQQFYQGLAERRIYLINTPEMYRHCHYLPESYEVIVDHAPRSVWLKHDSNFTMATVHTILETFGDRPIIVNDYVKSQKHYWHEACYIPSARDWQTVERVVQQFLELQDTDLNEGLVF